MSHFEDELSRAKARNYKLYVRISATVVVMMLALSVLFSMSGGTKINVRPLEASGGAEISVEGMGLFIFGSVYSIVGEPVVNISSPGYEPEKVIIGVDKKGGEITVTLLESPAHISFKSDPADNATRWQIDGRLVHEGKTLEHDLAAGSYTLVVNNSNFVPVEILLTLKRGQQHEENIVLQPFTGQIEIQSIPEGASVVLDSHDVGKTPYKATIEAGSHNIQLTLTGYRETTETFEVNQGQPYIQRNYRLQGLGGLLRFNVSPPGGLLLIDGLKFNPELKHKVDAGRSIQMSYQAKGHGTKNRSVILAPNEELTVDLHLNAQSGMVEVNSQPTAQVFVNGVVQGETPLEIDLLSVQHTITLKKAGYRSITKNVTPSPLQVTQVDASLIPELEADISEAKPQYRSVAGVELVLYQPKGDLYVMGAPRSERGQRANEFLRQVKLVAPFYAGRHEVTNGQYAQFKKNHSGDKEHPVVSIPWIDSVAFCNWLSGKEGLPPSYEISAGKLTAVNIKATGYRLLTEAEWEWLARKAGRDKQTVFPWGNDAVIPPKGGNVADQSAKGTTPFYVSNYSDGYTKVAPVGSFKVETSGLFDLVGNVSEWVHDFYALIPPNPKIVLKDPSGPSHGLTHVVKGSSWRSGTRTPLRASYRDGLLNERDDVGFRIGRYLSKSE